MIKTTKAGQTVRKRNSTMVHEVILQRKVDDLAERHLTFGVNGAMWLGGMNGVGPLSPGWSKLDA